MNDALEEIFARIRRPEVRDCCVAVLEGFRSFPEFAESFNVMGKKKSVHFTIDGVGYYGFSATNGWLKWYFRKPAMNAGVFEAKEVFSSFPEAEYSGRVEEKAEPTLKITSLDQVARIIEFVASHRVVL